ncbi:MAG TPA: T9SS type A sorting domain-containing protein [Bacteroidales bacterium]|nr:MAG: Chitinase A1 precursor [Bacteroidetes bacterium ADurb.Bin217]HPM13775.1 T9SS type A sorting domain-containing protein [Bacteroidales bacterium]
MQHKRLKLSAVLLFGIGLVGLQAQTMYVNESNGTQTAYTLKSVQKMRFSSGNLTVTKTDNSSNEYALNDLRYLNFSNISIDTEYPIAPVSLIATETTTSTVSLSWNASTDNIGITYYLIYKDGVKIDSATSTSYIATELTSNTAYSFTVKARDAANNISAASNVLSITTSKITSVFELNTDNIIFVYPNFVNNIINIDLSGIANAEGTFSILNFEGKTVLSWYVKNEGVLPLDISSLPTGIYLCRYETATEIKTVKIIKQ